MRHLSTVFLGSLAAFTGLALGAGSYTATAESKKDEAVYTRSDVSKHQSKEQRIWVTYKVGAAGQQHIRSTTTADTLSCTT